MTADVVPPWIDLSVHMVSKTYTRYTHAHDFNDGKISYNGMILTEAQIRQYFSGIGASLLASRTYTRDRTRMTVTLTLLSSTLWIDAKRLREKIDIDLRKHTHQK